MSTANAPTAKTLGEIALSAAIKAVKDDDSAAFTATVALGLVMANRQVERAETDKDITEKANKATFRHFLKKYAVKGNIVWRDSDHILNRAMALKGKDREKAISDYVDGGKTANPDYAKPDKARLVDGLAKLRTWSFRLMSDVCVNHADQIRDIIALKASGADGQAQAEHFREFVKRQYGDSFAKLTQRLAKPASEKEKADPIDAIVKKAGDMTDAELTLLIARLEGLRLERASTAEEVDAAFGESPAEAPTLIPAERELEAA
ncbi:hypothetical protein [Bradyrhizobium sp. th.b2]|uniref:hypothetical protein n=1 Tax=Bradyrhizobium sp. th-b2 TaxID=172088 RepID=UPI00041C42F3|nr:hypothetical protein [Bradyrhizobium sp. th.b2]